MTNRQKYENILEKFVGKTCYRSLACNSFKLRFESNNNQKYQDYIWIDPPWSFEHRNNIITEAYLCPHYKDLDYKSRFKEWCDLFIPLNESELIEYKFNSDESLILYFPNDYRLYIPSCEQEEHEEESWYFHWYVKMFNNIKD